MNSILKYGVIGGLLLFVFYVLARKFHLPPLPINMVLIPGGIMFTINGFLTPVKNRKHYNYFVGVAFGFLYALIAVGIGYGLFQCYLSNDPSNISFISVFKLVTRAFKSMFLLILISSFLVPVIFIKKEDNNENQRMDILDEEV